MIADARPDRLLVFGAGGQVGRSLFALAGPRLILVSREDVDLETDPAGAARRIAEADVAAVINAAAYTAVDAAEAESERAMAVNARAPQVMAEACLRRRLPLIHLSTDYVFDGSGRRPWTEADEPAPVNAYGRSKLAGERAVLAILPRSLVVRTSWVMSEFGRNFARSMLSKTDERVVRVVDDQVGMPTDALDLARFLLAAADTPDAFDDPDRRGLLHFRGGGPARSWADVAETLFAAKGVRRPKVERISSADMNAAAVRPLNSRLDIGRLESRWGHRPAPWLESAARIAAV